MLRIKNLQKQVVLSLVEMGQIIDVFAPINASIQLNCFVESDLLVRTRLKVWWMAVLYKVVKKSTWVKVEVVCQNTTQVKVEVVQKKATWVKVESKKIYLSRVTK